MDKRDFGRTVTISLAAGLLGGFVLSHSFRAEPVIAQARSQYIQTIMAEDFILVDESQRIRGSFQILPDGSPGILLNDANGKAKAKVSLLSDGSPSFSFYTKEGKDGLYLSVMPEGGGVLQMHDQSGTLRAEIGVGSRGKQDPQEMDSTVTLFDKHGELSAILTAEANGSPTLLLRGRGDPNPGAVLSVKDNRSPILHLAKGTPQLNLGDSKGKQRATLALGTDGSPVLWFFGTDGSQEVTLGGSNDKTAPALVLTKVGKGMTGGGLVLFDKEKLLQKIP